MSSGLEELYQRTIPRNMNIMGPNLVQGEQKKKWVSKIFSVSPPPPNRKLNLNFFLTPSRMSIWRNSWAVIQNTASRIILNTTPFWSYGLEQRRCNYPYASEHTCAHKHTNATRGESKNILHHYFITQNIIWFSLWHLGSAYFP